MEVFNGQVNNTHYGADVLISDTSRPVVFTFDTAGTCGPFRNRIGWGYDYVCRKGLNVVSFKEGDPEGWFRGPDFLDLVDELKDRLDFGRFPARITYGGSMGGYAASSLARRLSIDRALLCNPFSTLAPDLVPWETRYPERRRFDWTANGADGAAECSDVAELIVVADPLFEPDNRHALRYLAANPRAQYLRIPGVGHRMPVHMKALGVLDACFDHIAGLAPLDLAEFRRKVRSRRSYVEYYKWLLSEENRRLTPQRAAIITAHARRRAINPLTA